VNVIQEKADANCPPCLKRKLLRTMKELSNPENQLIPKVFHFVWVGDAQLKAENMKWMRSWITHNPDYRALLWMDKPRNIAGLGKVEVLPLPQMLNHDFIVNIGNWVGGKAQIASISDIVRYEILARFGGIYLDTDVECFQPLGMILENVKLFYADEWGPTVGNYMFGGIANHPALWTLVRELGPHLAAHKNKLSALDATGPRFLGERLRKHPDCVIFPCALFNPLNARCDHNKVTKWPEFTIANHHYQGTWYDQTLVDPPADFLK
jgi:mannosyltransferase OCH1-like enzyme